MTQKVLISGTTIIIASKYSDTQDMWLEYGPYGPNNIIQLKRLCIVPNPAQAPSSDFAAIPTIIISPSTDVLFGPYKVAADSNGTAHAAWFTGGCHGYLEDNTGATARTASHYILIDDDLIESDGIYTAQTSVILHVTNRIQAYNTMLPDGDQREVLEEVISWSVWHGKIDIDVNITALEDVHCSTYYGMQITHSGFNHCRYGSISDTAHDLASSSDSGGSITEKIKFYSVLGIQGILYVDSSYGLGDRQLAPGFPSFFSEGNVLYHGKTYANFVRVSSALPVGSSWYWRGSFQFYDYGYGKQQLAHCSLCGRDAITTGLSGACNYICGTCANFTNCIFGDSENNIICSNCGKILTWVPQNEDEM